MCGDILTNGKQSSIISPELDAFSLAIVCNLSEYKSRIVLCFPGVYGELNKSYLKKMCKSSYLTEPINNKLWLSQLEMIYETLKAFRLGNIIPNMITILNNSNDCSLSKSFTIGKDIDIDISLQSKIYYFNINIYNPFVDIFNNDNYNLLSLLNGLIKIYNGQTIDKNTMQLSDLYLQYLRKDSNNLYTNKELKFNSLLVYR